MSAAGRPEETPATGALRPVAGAAPAAAGGPAAGQRAVVVVGAGVCGHTATITTEKTTGYTVRLRLESDCPHVQKIAPEPLEVDAVRQIGLRGGLPSLLQDAYACCAHAACPVPSGLIKAVEVAAGLALPADVTMKISKG